MALDVEVGGKHMGKGKKSVPKIEVIAFGPVGPPKEVADPHAGKQPSKTMEPVVKAATGEKKVSLWDMFH